LDVLAFKVFDEFAKDFWGIVDHPKCDIAGRADPASEASAGVVVIPVDFFIGS